MRRALAFLSLPLLAIAPASGQELDCAVDVNFEAVATTHKDLLVDFQRDVADYLNNHRWGTEVLEEKIRCTLTIFIKNATGENRFSAQVFVGSQRPVFGSDRNSAVLRLFDENWEFTYIRTRPLNHNLLQYDDVASLLDYYAHLTIGHDYDTYGPLAGSPFFRTAADIANLGRSSGTNGWEQKTGSYTRLQIIDEILNPKYEPVRGAIYDYHFRGLDSLAADPGRAYANMLRALETIGGVRKTIGPRDLFVKSFFDAKYLEIAEVFAGYPDRKVYERLAKLDPAHLSTYEEALKRQD